MEAPPLAGRHTHLPVAPGGSIGAAMMAAPLIGNLDLEPGDYTHLAVHGPISVR